MIIPCQPYHACKLDGQTHKYAVWGDDIINVPVLTYKEWFVAIKRVDA